MTRIINNENETVNADASAKPSKLKKIKSAALAAGFYGTGLAVTGGSLYYSVKLARMQYEAARLNLEAAKQHLES